MQAREKNDISRWFKFFLTGIIETAESGVKTFEEILLLQKENEEKIKSLGSRSANALKVITELYKLPVIDANRVASITGLSNASAYTLISSMEKCGILSEVTGGKRGRVYMLRKYFNIFNK